MRMQAIKIYADGAVLADMLEALKGGVVSGLTTNPSLMRRAGVTDYLSWAREVLSVITDHPMSLEVFADEPREMYQQALKLAALGANVYVKVPVTNTAGELMAPLIRSLSRDGVKLNVTAILTLEQVAETVEALAMKVPAVVSVFAGRIADTGTDPAPLMIGAAAMVHRRPNTELLWASPRQVFDVVQAERCGCDIITCTPDILKKLPMLGTDLAELSLSTVRMFFNDAKACGFTL